MLFSRPRRFYENTIAVAMGNAVWSFLSVSLLPVSLFSSLASKQVRTGRLDFPGVGSHRPSDQHFHRTLLLALYEKRSRQTF